MTKSSTTIIRGLRRSTLTITLLIAQAQLLFAASLRSVAVAGQQVSGAPIGTVFQDFSSSFSLNDLGQIAFYGRTKPATSGGIATVGVWSEGDGNLAPVALRDTVVPGTPAGTTFTSMSGIAINNSGDVAFNAIISGPSLSGTGIWANSSGSLGLVARSGTQVPGFSPSTNFGNFRSSQFDDLGRVQFVATFTNSPTGSGLLSGGSSNLNLLAATERQAPGTPQGTSFFWRNGLQFTSNNSGNVVVAATLSASPFLGAWTDRMGSLSLLYRAGDASSAVPSDYVFADAFVLTRPPVINDGGQIAHLVGFNSTTGGPGISGIVRFDLAQQTMIARNGDVAPGSAPGNTFYRLGHPQLNNRGQVSFYAIVDGNSIDGNDNTGLWTADANGVYLTAHEGSVAAGVLDGAVYADFESPFSRTAFNDLGQVAFFAKLRGAGITSANESGIWVTDVTGQLHLVARAGTSIEVSPGDARVINQLSYANNGTGFVEPLINALGQVAFHASFTDGSEGVFISNIVAVPEPACLLLAGCSLFSFPLFRRPVSGRCTTR